MGDQTAEKAQPCPVTFALGLVDAPCRLASGHEGIHEVNDAVTFTTEWAEQTHEERAVALHDEAAPQAPGLGSLIERLLVEHWPNSGVNAWYLADLLRDEGVRYSPGQGGS